MLTDYHVHLETGPYTLEWVNKYVAKARERGITDLGFSEHAYRFKQTKNILFNPWIEKRQTEDINEYVGIVMEAKKKHPVKLGLEMDYIPGKEKEIGEFLESYPFDYVIGSVHWIDEWGFDLHEMIDKWESKEVMEIYEEYFSRIGKLLDSKLFDILGHIDVIKVFGHIPDKKDNELLINLYNKTVEKIKLNQIIVEVSTAGFRKPVKEIYPSSILMELIAQNNIPIILNSDAHHPNHVGENYDQGIAYLNKYGINKLSVFENRKKIQVPLK